MKILKTGIPLLAVLISVCLAACSNDDVKNSVVKPTYILCEIQSNNNSTILNYDNEGRFIDANFNRNTNYYDCPTFGYLELHFTYDSKTIKCLDSEISVFNLNNGLINSWKTDDLTFNYNYNDNRELESISTKSEVWSKYLWEFGLLISGGEIHSICNVDYYEDIKVNTDAMNILNALIIYEFLEDEYPWILAPNGYLGKLPTKPIKTVNQDDYQYRIIYDQIDANGCPGSVTIGGSKYLLKWRKR